MWPSTLTNAMTCDDYVGWQGTPRTWFDVGGQLLPLWLCSPVGTIEVEGKADRRGCQRRLRLARPDAGGHPPCMSTSPMERPVVYVDESANSGQNLLDPHQPVFTVAGVHLPDYLAASIVDEVRGQLPRNLREPKYTSLAGSSGGRKALMNAFARLPEGSVRTYLVHKRFMVMTKMVDVIVEPMAHRDGYNLYEGKETLALANMLHLAGPVMGDADAYDRMLQAFVNWVRQKATTDELYAAIAALKSSVQSQ